MLVLEVKYLDRMANPKTIFAVIQKGRLEYEALLFALSFRASNSDFDGRLIFAEPQPNHRWNEDPRAQDPGVRDLLAELDVEIVPFENEVWGQDYPNANKIEALQVLPKNEPFIFFDTDTYFKSSLATVDFDFEKPTASRKVEATWPKKTLYGPNIGEIWASLYDRFGLDLAPSLDPAWPDLHWRRYLYFNAGYFYFRCPQEFGARYLEYAREIDHNPDDALAAQTLRPWLDQVALPLVIHSLGGGRNDAVNTKLDGEVTHHYRSMSLFYARESDEELAKMEDLVSPNKLKKVLKNHEPFKKLIYQNKGKKARRLFADGLPANEAIIRKRLKNQNVCFYFVN